jgi:hypothetical protein
MTFFDENIKKFHSEKNLLIFSLDLDPNPKLDLTGWIRIWVSCTSMRIRNTAGCYRYRYLYLRFKILCYY